MAFQIFVVNPGSTSTKIAVFNDNDCVFEKVLRHAPEELKEFTSTIDQFEYRMRLVMDTGWDFNGVEAFVGRGGLLRPLKGGTYLVGPAMLEDLKHARYGEHASNLGAMIAASLAETYGKKAYIVDPPVVDELMPEARLTGLPQIKRISAFHALNHKAAAIRAAKELGIGYGEGRFIVAHLGGGISVGAHDCGRVIDVNNALEEGPFSPERAGSLPVGQLVDLCYSGKYGRAEMKKLLVGRGGLNAHTGTTDCRELEARAEREELVRRVLNAMVYRISKEICANAAALYGKIDAVIVTGGLAKSTYIVEGIKKRVKFLGRFITYPGESEMEALAQGVARVLEGTELAYVYEPDGSTI